ncbi:MAG: tRNA lysidine(34) synthetase TilS [Deltaproteobacteria bacterium]|nr:tRNA lysidine(34) synthetase TilS [Deltaproteobacteria bacterium]
MIQLRVNDFLRRFLSESGTAEIWVACSGGLDSMALLFLVKDFADRAGLDVGVLHFNHALRPEARDDELLVAAQAARLGLPLYLGQARKLKEQAQSAHLSLETAARRVRYAFFHRFLKGRAKALLVTAHNATDQVETIIMNLMRGSGLRGIKGIPQCRGRIGRPLLQVPRAKLAAYVAEKGIVYREDPSNSSPAFTRNRVRLELLPLLRKLGGVGVEERMAEAGLRLAADLEFIDDQLDLFWPRVKPLPDGLKVERRLLQQSPAALVPHILGRMIRRAGAVKQVSARVLDDLGALVGRPGERRESRYDLGGGLVFRALPELIKISVEGSRSRLDGGVPAYQMSLPNPGLYCLPHALGSLRVGDAAVCEIGPGFNPQISEQGSGPRFRELVDADKLHFPLQIRNRQPGDLFQPLGMGGKRTKLKKFLADRHLSRPARSLLPLLLDREGDIIWVVGLRLDHRFRVTAESRRVVELIFKE